MTSNNTKSTQRCIRLNTSLYSIQLLPPSFVLTTPRASLYLIQLILLWSSFTLPRPRVACIRYSNSYCLSSFLNPNISTNLLNFGLGNGLVKILDTFSSVGTYLTYIFPSSTAVLVTPPTIPAGMTGFRRNPLESAGMQINSTGMQPESAGIGINYLI